MKRILIFVSMILSLNLFGGLLHENLDTRVQFKAGGGTIKKDGFLYLAGELAMKSNIAKAEKYDIYVGGKINVSDQVVFKDGKYISNTLDIVPAIIIGSIESYSTFNVYQHLGLGLGYGVRMTKTETGHDFKHLGIFTVPIETGINYKNFLFNFGTEVKVTFDSKFDGISFPVSLGIGYEF